MTIGDRVRAWRTVKGKTLQQVAEQVEGLRFETLSKMERGLLRIPSSTTERIAAALGLSMVEFYGDVPETEDDVAAAS